MRNEESGESHRQISSTSILSQRRAPIGTTHFPIHQRVSPASTLPHNHSSSSRPLLAASPGSSSEQQTIENNQQSNYSSHDEQLQTSSDIARSQTVINPADSRVFIFIGPSGLQDDDASGKLSRIQLDIFDEAWFSEGWRWKELTPEHVKFYWEEFKKHFRWVDKDEAIYRAWKTFVAVKYKNAMWEMRVRNRKPRPSVTKEVWASWQEKWKDGNYKTKCEQNSRNRKSEKCGPGTGMSKHSCGSRSMIAHQKALTVKIGRKPNAFELHKYTHMKRKDGENSEWTDQRSQMVAERYQEKLNVANQRVEEGALEAQSVNEDEIFLDAADGLKKQKVYGLGTCGPIYYPKLNAGSKYSRTQQSFSESQEFQDTLAREVAQVKAHMEMQMQERENQLQAMMQERELQMQNQMWERESQLQSQVQVQMEAQMNAHLKAQADMEARIQQRMEAMMSSMGVRTTTSSSTAQNAETSGAI